MKAAGHFQGCGKSDTLMFEYLAGVGQYSELDSEMEKENLQACIKAVHDEIAHVRADYPAEYNDFVYWTSKWMLGFCSAIECLIDHVNRSETDRKLMGSRAAQEYFCNGSPNPNRKRDSDIRKLSFAY